MAQFSRLKNWIAEVLSYADLNAEIDNILNNLYPGGIDSMSTGVPSYRLSTDPGEVGTENIPDSLQGEIERLRYVIAEMKGGDVDYWYESAAVSLTTLKTAIGGALQTNRISSGAASSLSSAARFIVPNGAAASFLINGSPTPLAYVISDTPYSISTDAATTSIGTAPSSNNTCLVNDAALASQEFTKHVGEDGSVLTVDAMGTELTALTGKLASFKIVSGANTEYFIGLVKSSTQLTNCLRGFYYDSTLAQLPRIVIADNDTITLMRTAWVFANTAQSIVLAYNNPTWAYAAPTSPNTGDYWYDMTLNYWKTYNSVTWITADAILVGMVILNSTNCIGARSFEFFSLPVQASNLEIEYVSVTTVQATAINSAVGVGSNNLRFNYTRPSWSMATDIESGYAEVASTTYYAYLTEAGKPVLSPLKPYDMRGPLGGYYHPYEIWRYVGRIQNGSGSDLDSATLVSPQLIEPRSSVRLLENLSLVASVSGSAMTIKVKTKAGTDPSPGDPVVVTFHDGTATSGNYLVRKITAPLSMTITTTATLGHTSAAAEYIWVHFIDDAGVIDLAVMGRDAIVDMSYSAATIMSATSDSGTVLYSGISHSGSKPVRLVGRISSTQAAAGVYDTTPAEVSVGITPTVTTTDHVQYTPTFGAGLGTVVSIEFWWSRRGDSMYIQGLGTVGTVTGGAAGITFPNSLTSKLGQNVGYCSRIAVDMIHTVVTSAGATTFSLCTSTTRSSAGVGNALFSNGQSFVLEAGPIPITGWSKYGP